MKISIGTLFKSGHGKYRVTAIAGTVTDEFGQQHQICDELDFIYYAPTALPAVKSTELDGVERAPVMDKLRELIAAYNGEADDYFNDWEQNFISDLDKRLTQYGSKIQITPNVAAKIEEVYENMKENP